MANLKNCYVYLKKILSKEETFTNILNRTILTADMAEKDAKIVKDTLKSTINKFFFLHYEVCSSLDTLQLKDEEKNVLIIALAMYHYVKNMTLEYIVSCFDADLEWFKNEIPEFQITVDIFKKILEKIGPKPIEIPEKYNTIMAKKLSLLFSYPEWIIKLFFKQFGYKDTLKSLRASRHNVPIVINYNPLKIESSQLDSTKFTKTLLSTTAYSYSGEDKIIELPLFKENKIFVEEEAYQLIVDVLDPRQGENMLFIDDSRGVTSLDAALRVGDFAKIQVACKNIISLNNVKRMAYRFNIRSITAFESDMKLLITHVPEKDFDKVLVIPESSNLGMVRKKPDILLTLKRKEVDTIIENEKYSLKEASNFVKNGGSLIYCVFTMNNNESQEVIKDFLANNQEFKLIEERQIFPYLSLSEGFYYALLRRGM